MSTSPDERRSSEIRGLDTVLRGGFLCRRSYLVSGAPGTGKTILGLHFLDRGLQLEERPLLITFSEPAASLERNLGNLGFSFDRIKVLDLTPPVKLFSDAETVSELEPQRVLVDGSLTLTQKTRKASVSKFRGSGFAGGEHTLRIGDKGIPMFPTLTVRRDVPKRGTVQIPFSIEKPGPETARRDRTGHGHPSHRPPRAWGKPLSACSSCVVPRCLVSRASSTASMRNRR